MTARMKDIAQACGVSIKTVSNVINRASNVGPKTQKQVMDAIRRLNYVPNAQARQLVLKQKGAKSPLGHRIGCVFPQGVGKYDNSYYTMIFKGIEEEIADRHQQLSFIASAGELEQHPLKMNYHLSREHTDGVISFVGADHADLFERVRALPFVLVGETEEAYGADTVCVDKIGGVTMLLDHLQGLGHREFGYIGPVADDRFRTFRAELEGRGLPLRDGAVAECAWGMDGGRAGGEALLRRKTPATAVVAASDLVAFGAMHAFMAAGLRIPDDLSITGYDNLPETEIVYPPLTSVDIDKEGIGRLAARLVLEKIDHPDSAPRPARHTFPARLVARRSTGKAKA